MGRRLKVKPDASSIGRLDVARNLRRNGLGRTVWGTLLTKASERGDHTVALQVQVSAKQFYQGEGLELSGSAHLQAGVELIEMRRHLV